MGANCVASTSICGIICYKGCNTEKVKSIMTFIPPPNSYRVVQDTEDASKLRMEFIMEELKKMAIYRQAAEASEVRRVKTRNGSDVPIVWIHNERAKESTPSGRPPMVLLHSHGNATDIGLMMVSYYQLSRCLSIEVVGVEYSGYGAATGKACIGNTYADIEAAYNYIVSTGVAPNRIVAYGQSIGSGPVVNLAAKFELGGVVLHSPLLSGISVIDPEPNKVCRPSCVYTCFDFYENFRRVRSVKCPVLVMHGQRDDVVPFYHGVRLHKKCPEQYRWPGYFPTRAGHHDIVESDPKKYFGEVSHFLYNMQRRAMGEPAVALPLVQGGPSQVEMARTGSSSWSSANGRTGKAETPAAGMKAQSAREVVLGTPPAQPSSVDDFLGEVKEVPAGPEDGRYRNLRRERGGNIGIGAGENSPCSPSEAATPTHQPEGEGPPSAAAAAAAADSAPPEPASPSS